MRRDLRIARLIALKRASLDRALAEKMKAAALREAEEARKHEASLRLEEARRAERRPTLAWEHVEYNKYLRSLAGLEQLAMDRVARARVVEAAETQKFDAERCEMKKLEKWLEHVKESSRKQDDAEQQKAADAFAARVGR